MISVNYSCFVIITNILLTIKMEARNILMEKTETIKLQSSKTEFGLNWK